MPNIKSAIKKLKQDKKRTALNLHYKKNYKNAVKTARSKAENKGLKPKELSQAYSAIDKAKKKGVIHKNKAARLKSSIAGKGKKK